MRGNAVGNGVPCQQGAPTHGRHLNPAPLGTAAAAGHLAIVQYLIERRHVPLNSRERPFGATPLFIAASFLQLNVVRYLLANGADPAIPNAHGETALRRVQQLMHLRPKQRTPDEAKLFTDLLTCLSGGSVEPRHTAPPSGAGPQGMLAHLIKPRKEWHYWL